MAERCYLLVCRDYSVLPPEWIVWLGERTLRAVYAFLDAAIPPPLRVFDQAFTGCAQAEVIRTLCALGVAEALASGPKTAEALAKELGEGSTWFLICTLQPSSDGPSRQVAMSAHSPSHLAVSAQHALLESLERARASTALALSGTAAAAFCQHTPQQGTTT